MKLGGCSCILHGGWTQVLLTWPCSTHQREVAPLLLSRCKARGTAHADAAGNARWAAGRRRRGRCGIGPRVTSAQVQLLQGGRCQLMLLGAAGRCPKLVQGQLKQGGERDAHQAGLSHDGGGGSRRRQQWGAGWSPYCVVSSTVTP